MPKLKRNDVCHCGSGKKYKVCCMKKDALIKEVPKYRIRDLLNASSFILNPKFKLEVLRVMPYNGTYIYVFHYLNMFQYLFSLDNKIYQDHIFLRPTFFRRILSVFKKPLYTQEELEYGEQVMLSGAMKSLDVLVPNREVPLNK